MGIHGVNLGVTTAFCVYFCRCDRELLTRRMLRKEKIRAQKIILFLMKVFSGGTYVLCGLDHRFGWSQTWLILVPGWLTALALVFYAAGNFLFVPVLNANRFAASVIQIEADQTIADRRPYRIVRHPMYSVGILLWLWTPLALGSFVALPVALLIIPILVWRLLDEEKILQRELPGYIGYWQRTHYRLIPFVW